jgi:hypothetical protein
MLPGEEPWAVGSAWRWVDTIPPHWDEYGAVYGSGNPISFTLNYTGWGNLMGVDAVSSNDVWAVGTFFWHWNGTFWLPGDKSVNLISISMCSANDGWAVGYGGKIYRWDGSAWTKYLSPTTEILRGVTMLSCNEGWAVGANGTILHYSTGRTSIFLPLVIKE